MKTRGQNTQANQRTILVISLAAILGALVSLVLARSKQIRAFISGLRQPAQEDSAADAQLEGSSASIPSLEASGAPAAAPAVSLPAPRPVASPASRSKTAAIATPVQPAAVKMWSTPTRYIMGVFLFLAVLIVLYIGRSAIPMVIAAALLAVFVDPAIQFLKRRAHLKKGLAVGLIYLLVVALLLLVPLLAIPSIVNAVNYVMNIDVQLVLQRLNDFIASLHDAVEGNPALAALLGPLLDSLSTTVNGFLTTSQTGAPGITLSVTEITSRIGTVLGTLSRFLGPTVSAVVSIFFTLLLSLQMTLTADGMRNWYADLIPPGQSAELTAMTNKIRRTWTGFLRGQMSLMLIIGVITWLGASILGLPQAILLGLIAGMMELIPSIGPIIAMIPAVALALLVGSTHLALDNLIFALIVVAFYVLVQLLENQLLVPRIMGDAVDLPPLVVLIGTIAGAGAYGIMGALLATPVIATGNLVFRYVYRKITEEAPTPPPAEQEPDIWAKAKELASRLARPFTRRKQPATAQEKATAPPTKT